jgi:hypothetical protein
MLAQQSLCAGIASYAETALKSFLASAFYLPPFHQNKSRNTYDIKMVLVAAKTIKNAKNSHFDREN